MTRELRQWAAFCSEDHKLCDHFTHTLLMKQTPGAVSSFVGLRKRTGQCWLRGNICRLKRRNNTSLRLIKSVYRHTTALQAPINTTITLYHDNRYHWTMREVWEQIESLEPPTSTINYHPILQPRRLATRQMLVKATGQMSSICGDPGRNDGVDMGGF